MRSHAHHRPLFILLAALVFFGFAAAFVAPAMGAAEDDATVVRELTGMRNQYSSTYLLDNGFYRTVFSQEPVHFKDASGIWQAIDTTLAAGKQGEFVTRAAPVAVTISPTASEGRSTVALSGPAGPVGLDLIGASRASLAVTGSEAGLSGVLTSTDLTYAATGDGVKETLVLRSAEAPAGFNFRLTHAGYTLRQEEGQ